MISKNVPHTYRQHGKRYYALIRKVQNVNADADLFTAYDFYMFDEDGYCFFQITHTELSFIYSIGKGILKQRSVLWVQDDAFYRRPNVASDEWIQGCAEKGFALETIREGLGLDLTYLNEVFEKEENCL